MSRVRRLIAEALEDRRLFSGGLVADNSRLIFGAVAGGAPAAAQTVNLTNNGTDPITIALGGEAIDGVDASEFSVVGGDALPVTIQPGMSAAVSVQTSPTHIGPAGAILHIIDDDPTTPETDITLRGLGTKGQFDTLEPSLQWILDTYQIPVNVGTSDPTRNTLDIVPLKPNDEVTMNLLEKAGPGPVTIDPIAAYTSVSTPALLVGSYTFTGGPLSLTQAFSVPAADVQTMNPHMVGSDQFDPGASIFGLYTQWPGQKNRMVYTEDFRNTWQPDARLKRAMRFYPMKNPDGSVVPNAYVVAVEEATNHDYQDVVLVVRNVRLANPSESPSGVSASAASSKLLTVKWTNNAANATAVTIDRAVDGGPFAPVATLGPTIKQYNDYSVTAGSRYQYRVQAIGADGVTDYAYSGFLLAPVTYEAESAGLAGPLVRNAYKGFTGTGYAAFQKAAGDSIHWSATVNQVGVVTLTFRYANVGANRPLKLSVNGMVVKSSLSFTSTGAWTTWHTVSLSVNLAAGVNDIILTSIGLGGPNMDSMAVR